VRRLSDMLQLEPATLSPLVKRLEAAGLLRRGRESGNERALALTLTEKGWQLREEALKVPPAVVSRLGMSIPELMDLHRVLTRVIAATQPGGS
jgi:MarR family transcriptional regulator, organic hydroperoxide resistance regulator